MDHPVTAGIVANPTKPDAVPRTLEIVERLREQKVRLLLESATACAIGETGGLPLAEIANSAEVIVVLGGDGTILHTARQLGPKAKPLAAINTGRLGFLTTAMEDELGAFVRTIAQREYEISHRSLLHAEFDCRKGIHHSFEALNEVTFSRGASSRMIRLEAYIDGEFLNRYSGDGLIVATPTGSTAYSLSAGGPLVNPSARVFLVTPICPHALASRSFVVNDDVEMEVRPEEHQREEILVSTDGSPGLTLKRHTAVRIRRAGYALPLVTFPNKSFYTVLQQKLRWMGYSA